MKNLFLLALLLCSLLTNAQTAYHTNLLDQWSTQYGLTGGSWAIASDEQLVLNAMTSYGGSITEVSPAPTGQPFTKAKKQTITTAGVNNWDAAAYNTNTVAIAAGERVLVTMWVKCTDATSGFASLFIEHATTYAKEAYFSTPIANTWTQMTLAFEADTPYPIGKLRIGYHTGGKVQTLQFAGFAMRNFGTTYPLSQFPNILSQSYEGAEADAPWRAEAAISIEQIRKADLNIAVKDNTGAAASGATVKVKMLEHQFKFGSAITANKIANNNAQSDIYESKITNFDGEGHSFNEVVYENDFKWDAWEDNWFVSYSELINSVNWLRDRKITIRGHNFVWPGWQWLPDDMLANKTNLPYLKNRYNQRINKMLTDPGLVGKIAEWDAINEITVNEDLANAFKNTTGYTTGREIYVEMLNKAKEINPTMPLYLNDYVTLDQGYKPTHPTYIKCKKYVQEIYDAGGPFDGIGFQAHIGGGLVSMYDTKATLDDFYNSFGKRAKITEYDLSDLVNDTLSAKFTGDLLTLCFAHPSVDGFLTWGFWDGAHWKNHSPFYNLNWTPKPTVATVSQLLFHDWWTPETTLTTDAAGMANIRGFKGVYEITQICNGQVTGVDTIDLFNNLQLDLVCGTTAVNSPSQNQLEMSFPSPISAYATFTLTLNNTPEQVRLLGADGRVVKLWNSPTTSLEIIAPNVGTYWIEAIDKAGKKTVRALVVVKS
jgi:endo-1,4-beta-xylanase